MRRTTSIPRVNSLPKASWRNRDGATSRVIGRFGVSRLQLSGVGCDRPGGFVVSTHVQFTDSLAEKLSLADILRLERMCMPERQDLPGSVTGRVVRAIDQVLTAIEATSVVGGG